MKKRILPVLLAGIIFTLSAVPVAAKTPFVAVPYSFAYCDDTVTSTNIVHGNTNGTYDIYYFCETKTSNIEEMRGIREHACYVEHYVNYKWAGVKYNCSYGYTGEHAS